MSTPDNAMTPGLAREDGSKLGGDTTESQWSAAQWEFVSRHLFAENRTLAWMREEFAKAFGKTIGISTWGKIWKRELARRSSLEARLVKRREASASAKQLREEARASGTDFGEAALQRIEEIAFDTAMGETVDLKGLNELARTILQARAQNFEREKFTAGLKSKIDAGLDALFQEIKGNAAAEDLFTRLRGVVTKEIKA